MNESNSDQGNTEAKKWEVSRLWHELKESHAREGLLAKAGCKLISAIDNELGNALPGEISKAREQLVSALPRDLRQKLDPVAPPYVEEKMGKLTKRIMLFGFPIMLGLLVWAYAVTLAAD